MLSRLSPGVRAALAALGVVIGVALVFLGLGAFQPEPEAPPGVIVPTSTTDVATPESTTTP